MGKASTLHETLRAQPLSAAEVERRRVEAESGGDVQARPDGSLVKVEPESQAERQVAQAPRQTWD